METPKILQDPCARKLIAKKGGEHPKPHLIVAKTAIRSGRTRSETRTKGGEGPS
jgi:hypothetical protein